MTLRFVDSPDRYPVGNAEDVGLAGVWDAFPVGASKQNFQIVVPSFGSRTGEKAYYVRNNGNTGDIRANLSGAAVSEVFFALAHHAEILPSVSGIMQYNLFNAGAARVCAFNVEPTGRIAFRDSGANVLGETANQVIFAGQWKFLEFRVRMGAGDGIAQIRDEDGTFLLNLTGLNIPGTISMFVPRSQTGGAGVIGNDFYFTDISVKSTDGVYNNTWYPTGGVRNFVVRPNADVDPVNWNFIARRIYDIGVGDISGEPLGSFGPPAANCFSIADAASLEIGAGDFTVEGTFRWNRIPVAGEVQTLASKWNLGTQRSWRLILYENGGVRNLSFETSTDGTTGTVIAVHDFPFTPDKWRPYTISVSRVSGVNRLFIDGVRVGPAATDARTYFNSSAPLAIGARWESGTFTFRDQFIGWLDEIRYTVGVGRYVAEYTPATVKFPRDIAGDPSFASVQLLMGFDSAPAADESSAGRAVSQINNATVLITDDGLFAYESINKIDRDDTFIEAAFLPSNGTYELTGLPAATETVTIGATTYTFRATVPAANDVLIGVDADETIENLIAAVNQESGAGVKYGTGTVANASAFAEALPGAIARIEALVPGTAGNSIVFTTTVVNSAISGSGTLTGGLDIPSPSTYLIERLPRGVTRVDSVSLFTRRSVFGPGGATMTPSFVDGSNASSNGATTAAPANPAWQVDKFDANGGNAWSVANFVGSRVRVTRNT